MPSHQERRRKRYTCSICGTSLLAPDSAHDVRADGSPVPTCVIVQNGIMMKVGVLKSIDVGAATPDPVS